MSRASNLKARSTREQLGFRTVNERFRVYIFPGNVEMKFSNVTAIAVRPSGNHRLEYDGGKKAIVSPGWSGIFIDSDNDWEF